MLRWSAEITGRRVDLGAIANADIDPGVPGGRSLTRLARAGTGLAADASPLAGVAVDLGHRAAVDAAAVVAAFESFNRVVDGTGLPVGRGARRDHADIIELLGLMRFPHAHHGA